MFLGVNKASEYDAEESIFQTPEHRRTGEINIHDRPPGVGRQIAHRRQLIEIAVASPGNVELDAGSHQFLIAHLKLDLMNVQTVDKHIHLRLRGRLGIAGSLGKRELSSLAGRFRRMESRNRRFSPRPGSRRQRRRAIPGIPHREKDRHAGAPTRSTPNVKKPPERLDSLPEAEQSKTAAPTLLRAGRLGVETHAGVAHYKTHRATGCTAEQEGRFIHTGVFVRVEKQLACRTEQSDSELHLVDLNLRTGFDVNNEPVLLPIPVRQPV